MRADGDPGAPVCSLTRVDARATKKNKHIWFIGRIRYAERTFAVEGRGARPEGSLSGIQSTSADLLAAIPHGEVVLVQNAYHLGELVTLRRVLGAWGS